MPEPSKPTYMPKETKPVYIDYTNHRRERMLRHILPKEIFWGESAWHSESQWLLRAWDFDKHDERTFALKDIHGWYAQLEDYK